MIKLTLPFPPSVNAMFGGGSKQKRFPSKSYKQWKENCPELPELKISDKIHIHYIFFWPDNRIRDGQSYIKATTDQLVRSKVIKDDNWKIVVSESWKSGGVDKGNARVEIQITKQDL